jgi:hypothetical protein
MLREMVSNISIDREVWSLGVELLRAKRVAELDQSLAVKSELERQLTVIDKKMSKLLDMRMNEEITHEEYAVFKKDLLDKQTGLKEKLIDREHSTANWLELAEKCFETAFQAREIMEGDDGESKKNLIKTIGWNLFLKEGKLAFEFRNLFDGLVQTDLRGSVQRSTHKFEPSLGKMWFASLSFILASTFAVTSADKSVRWRSGLRFAQTEFFARAAQHRSFPAKMGDFGRNRPNSTKTAD